MEEVADRPKWLLELENRKRKPRLAHEAGAGALCMVCKNACPGLDLHFWRKICKNCKCSRDDHDVIDDDDFPQFDLLFGPSKKFKKKPIFLRVNHEKQHENETVFEWIPPDTTKELATDYMKALPADKLPIKGSAGAALRKKLLQKQLPLHDIDYITRDELSEPERKEFEKYLENIKKYVGQGKVIKMFSARPFDRSLMTPANATDMQRFSPQHKPCSNTNPIQLRTPSCFSPKHGYSRNYGDNQSQVPNPPDLMPQNAEDSNKTQSLIEKFDLCNITPNYDTVHSKPLDQRKMMAQCKIDSQNTNPPAPPHMDNSSPLNRVKTSLQEYKDILRHPTSSTVLSKPIDSNAEIIDSILADAFLPPSTIHSAEIIGSTLDEKRLMFIREKLSNKYSAQENKPVHNTPQISRALNADGLQNKDQNPPMKDANTMNVNNENANVSILPGKIDMRTELLKTDQQTAQSISLNNPGINVQSNLPKPLLSHEEKSTDCQRMLPNLIGTEQIHGNLIPASHDFINNTDPLDNNAYSERNVSSTMQDPSTPMQQIIAGQNVHPAKLSSSTVSANKIYSEDLHNQVFPHAPIGSESQVARNIPNVEDFKGAMEEKQLSKLQKCHKCSEDIRIGDVAVTIEKATNAAWHPGCFVCCACNELLVDLVYFHYKNKLYCGRDLASLLGIPRCFACDELIFVREYTVAEGHSYHVQHFCCWDCDLPLADQKYITENDRPLCLPCYQNTYAKTCKTCNNVIAADQQGVSVKDLNFHAIDACFCCSVCKKNLLNSRMTVKHERLFCSKECISEFLHTSM